MTDSRRRSRMGRSSSVFRQGGAHGGIFQHLMPQSTLGQHSTMAVNAPGGGFGAGHPAGGSAVAAALAGGGPPGGPPVSPPGLGPEPGMPLPPPIVPPVDTGQHPFMPHQPAPMFQPLSTPGLFPTTFAGTPPTFDRNVTTLRSPLQQIIAQWPRSTWRAV